MAACSLVPCPAGDLCINIRKKTWLIKLLTIRWREWLTDYYLNRWFADKNYYFTQIYGEHKNTDNPDQRIAEDILLLISKTLSLSFASSSHLAC
ncbi:hypothetical protein [Shigella boydii]|uniref:hypothetical protein n=1 Tax=Shigella boydii TaxID=621 RepID=UPI0021F54C7F|nr:hypothetical protein [Shigella boydii]